MWLRELISALFTGVIARCIRFTLFANLIIPRGFIEAYDMTEELAIHKFLD